MREIKSMKLYTNIERVYNELAELGKVDSDPLTVSQLSALDQGKLGGVRLYAKRI